MSALNFLCGILLSCRRVSLCFIKLLVLFVGCATYRSFGNLIMPFFVLINNLHKLLEALTNVEKFYLSSIRFVYNQFSRSLTNWAFSIFFFFFFLSGEKPPEYNYKQFLSIFKELVMYAVYLNRTLKISVYNNRWIHSLFVLNLWNLK